MLPSSGTVLEVASGSGQHAVHFAQHLAHLIFIPSDVDPTNLASIRAWVQEAALPNLHGPLEIDVRCPAWGIDEVDAIFNANMVHITPWECTHGLLEGAAKHLRPDGLLVMYGPFRIAGAHTAPSNLEFHDELQRRDPRFGVRDLEAVSSLGEDAGLCFSGRYEMPANNQCLVFQRPR